MEQNNFDTLKEICEIKYNGSLFLCGFGKKQVSGLSIK